MKVRLRGNTAGERMNGFITATGTTCTLTLHFIRYNVQPLVNTNKLISPTHNTIILLLVVAKTNCWKFKAGARKGVQVHPVT